MHERKDTMKDSKARDDARAARTSARIGAEQVADIREQASELAQEVGRDIGRIKVALVEQVGFDIAVVELLANLSERVEALEDVGPVELVIGGIAPEPQEKRQLTDDQLRRVLNVAVQDRTPVAFLYEKDEPNALPELRVLSPYEVYTGGSPARVLVTGYDHDRRDLRQFRIDRIVELAETPAGVSYRPVAAGV